MSVLVRCVSRSVLGPVLVGAITHAFGLAAMADSQHCGFAQPGILMAGTQGRVRLKTGDTLTFSPQTGPDVAITLELIKGVGAPRVLSRGPRGTTFTYTAEASGDFGFRLTIERGVGGAAVAVTCTPAGISRDVRGGPSVTRRATGMAELGRKSPLIAPDVDMPEPTLDLGAVTYGGRHAMSAERVGEPSPVQAGVADTPLKWEASRGSAAGEDAAGPLKLAAKFKLQPAMMIGVLAQFDQPDDNSPAPSTRSDQNWLAGPVTSLQLLPGTTLDARAAWGPLDTGAAASIHGADRRLIDARLASTQTFGSWRFSPSVSMNYLEESRQPTAGHEGLQATGAGRVDVRPEVAYRIDTEHSLFVEPKAAIGGFWDLDNQSQPAPGTIAHGGMRLKADTGVTIGNADGAKLEIGAGVEEAAAGSNPVWSGRFQLSVPLK
jgi:hypothetical protein